MSDISIMTSKCLHTSHWLHIRCLYHQGSALVPILHEQVRLPPKRRKSSSETSKRTYYTLQYGKSDPSIMTSKYLYTSHWLYIRCLYHSGNALVPILQEQVSFPPKRPKSSSETPKGRHVRL